MYDQLNDDMERDPKELNTHIQVAFEDVFGEPSHVHSISCNWRTSRLVYNASLRIIYTILTTLCALPTALCCGIKFACLAYETIWCHQPVRQGFSLWLVPIKGIYNAMVRCLLDPFMQSFATCWQKTKAPKACESQEKGTGTDMSC